MEKILSLFWLVILAGACGSGCGTTGNTSRFVVHIPVSSSTTQATIKIASANVETNAAHLGAAAVYAWGRFDTNDLTHIEESLHDTLLAALPVRAINPDLELRVHVVIRRYFVETSNTGGAILVCVAWAATDARNKIIYHEQFYAPGSVYLVGTIGLLKDSVHRNIVRRIATVSIDLASHPGGFPPAGTMENTFVSFEEAASHLPKRLFSMGDPILPVPVVSKSVAKPGWEAARPVADIDWEQYLVVKPK